MEDYQLKVVKEKEELDIKLELLSKFLDLGVIDKIDEKQAGLLTIQKYYMSKYSEVLGERINLF